VSFAIFLKKLKTDHGHQIASGFSLPNGRGSDSAGDLMAVASFTNFTQLISRPHKVSIIFFIPTAIHL